MFKYELGQTVWYLKDNKIHSAKIGARTFTEVDPEVHNTRPFANWSPRLLYGTIHGNWKEDQIYRSIDEMFNALKANAIIG